ncbi:hypothetical protein FSP39_003814 [Pinctada imbricata]|uniref:Uncharacterized protein n=1 Tax=Pinctada imbricata TaxID=66713 RepID=A0AA88Y6J5_PINIB|nr:hypothetical protein FSP39_003814 [Pinctada imbricata]
MSQGERSFGAKGLSEPPPSYDSIFGRVKAAKQQSESKPKFFKSLLAIVIGTLGCTICLGFFLAIPISMVVMGAIYKDDCPIQRYIPIYLIVGGSFGILKNLTSLGQKAKNDRDEEGDEKNMKSNPYDVVLNLFLFAWFIAGNVWVYQIRGAVSSDITSVNYCHPTLYAYAFWLITSVYILLGTTCCCVCCAGCLASMVSG